MKDETTQTKSIPVHDRPPSQERCGPVSRVAGMNVYCGRCGTEGLIDYSTGYCLGCQRKLLSDTPSTIDPGR